MNKIRSILLTTLIAASATASAQMDFGRVNFHTPSDTIRINDILIEAQQIKSPQARVLMLARKFLDTPYVSGTLENKEGGEEMLVVNLDQLDCTTLIDNVAALAYTAGEGRTSWRDFLYNLERMRYRGGQMNGYCSRLHYISDWIVDNTHRGNFREFTDRMPSTSEVTKTIDFMSANASRYPALSDPDVLQCIKNFESGYRNHRYLIVKWPQLNNRPTREALVEGDIVALTTNTPRLDVAHMGIIVKDEKGIPHLLHASSKEGKVIIDPRPLVDYLRRNKLTGFRVIRLLE